MNLKISDAFIGLVFIGLLIGTATLLPSFKSKLHIPILAFGLMTLASLFVRKPFKTSVPFYIFLAAMVYINIFILTNLFVDAINPEVGWIIDEKGERRRVMQMNWVWGVLSGLIISPLTILIYHKFVKRNRYLEISLTIIFIVMTTITFLIKALH